MTDIPLPVRTDDCDAFGHVNNSVYISYVQYAFAKTLIQFGFGQDWLYTREMFWQLKTFTIEYQQPAVFGDILHATLWLEHADPMYPQFGCEIIKSDFSGQHAVQTVARIQTEWQRIDCKTGEPVPLQQHVLAYFPQTKGSTPRPFAMPGNDGLVKQHLWQHRVVRSEIGTGEHVRPQAIYDWLADAVFEALTESGWAEEKRRKAECAIFQKRHDTEFFHFPEAGETVHILSRLVNVQKFRAVWLQEVVLMPHPTLCVLDYSTDIFVDALGQPSIPPSELVRDVQALK